MNNTTPTRSPIPKIIGIITLVLGVLALVASVMGLVSILIITIGMKNGDWGSVQALGIDTNYLTGSSIISIIMAAWAIFIGIKLIKYLDIGRRHFNYSIIVTIIISIAVIVYSQIMMSNENIKPGFTAAGMLLLPTWQLYARILLLIVGAVLLNKKDVKDSLTQ